MTNPTEMESSHDIGVDELEKLLELAEEQGEQHSSKSFIPYLKDDETFSKILDATQNKSSNIVPLSPNQISKPEEPQIIAEELDSSDDEEVRNFLERKYNEYGRDINKNLKQQNEQIKEDKISREINESLQNSSRNRLSSNFTNRNNSSESKSNSSLSTFNKNTKREAHAGFNNVSESNKLRKQSCITNNRENQISLSIYTDPIFGMRLTKPLVSSSVLTERMSGRKPVAFSSIQYHIQCGDMSKDWVIAGAVVHKSAVKTTKNGAPYSIWNLSDLKCDIKTVSVFLFKSAHKDLWKTATGMVVAILNPGVFEKRAEKNDQACLCVDTSQKVMILGQSKDMGTCKAKKKNGEPCGAIVNLGDCDFCIFHIKQEFGRMSKRSELQSSTAGRGLNELRNKVLGKSEVFYAGQSYTAIPAKKSAKQTAKDESRLMTLSEYFQSPNASSVNHISNPKLKKDIPYAARDGHSSKLACNVETNIKQRLKDLERLKILKGDDFIEGEDLETSKSGKCSSEILALVPEKFKSKEFSFSQKTPKLSKDNFSFEVNMQSKVAKAAKIKAMQVIKNKPIKKSDPNFIKYRGTTEGKKRAIDELDIIFQNESKKMKLDQQKKQDDERKSRIQRIMDATSSHTNLIQAKEDEEQTKYFNKLEKKEAMEEKMLNTFKVPCKAVICRKCKYTAFSAADRCKEEKHPIKVIDAEKRFFQCQDCGNRTATVQKIPKLSCKNCQGSRWQRAAMIREKKTINPSSNLSIRGDEEKFIGSMNTSVNLNLLVPDE